MLPQPYTLHSLLLLPVEVLVEKSLVKNAWVKVFLDVTVRISREKHGAHPATMRQRFLGLRQCKVHRHVPFQRNPKLDVEFLDAFGGRLGQARDSEPKCLGSAVNTQDSGQVYDVCPAWGFTLLRTRLKVVVVRIVSDSQPFSHSKQAVIVAVAEMTKLNNVFFLNKWTVFSETRNP